MLSLGPYEYPLSLSPTLHIRNKKDFVVVKKMSLDLQNHGHVREVGREGGRRISAASSPNSPRHFLTRFLALMFLNGSMRCMQTWSCDSNMENSLISGRDVIRDQTNMHTYTDPAVLSWLSLSL